jgi:FAD/FMN-containing dehydrogenase
MAGTFKTRSAGRVQDEGMAAVIVSDVRAGPGLIFRPGDPGYGARRCGFNLAVEHRPAVIVDAGSPADVVSAVRLAAREGRPLAVMNTGHGPSVPADGAVLVRIGRLRRVGVDPGRRTARVEGGAVWRDVIDAAAPHGLAPLNGSSPAVGVAGYTLGGGVGLLARRFGFAADHVRSVDLVTADGRLRHVTAGADPDLFWALRGAGANFGVAIALEIDLFPVARLVGGELCFPPEACGEVLATYAAWAGDVPETMASSVLLAPDPAQGGGLITHVRVADSGDDHAEARHWVERLRRIGPRLVDTVRVMPYADVGTIHHEPVDTPVPAFDRNVLLSRFDEGAAATLARHAGPAAPGGVLAELRAWGGALSRPADPPNAVGGRDAHFSLLAIADPDPGTRARRDALLDALRPWSTGGAYPNFSGVEDTGAEAVRRGYWPEDFARLRQIKAAHDPDNRFRVNFNIPPEGRTLR